MNTGGQCVLKKSGHQDSNLGPPGPKPGALTGLRYAPSFFIALRCDLNTY